MGGELPEKVVLGGDLREGRKGEHAGLWRGPRQRPEAVCTGPLVRQC